MSSWGRFPPDFRSRATVAAGRHEGRIPRPAPERDMVNGIASDALRQAVKAYSVKHQRPIYKLLADMNLGSSTWDRMVKAKPIAQTTVLKIVKFLGTSLPAVMTLSQQEKGK